ncbi:MAG: glycosyltransferase [Candidatus Pacebacteria bacterium]|nr:glycosyltransferase [Candidatus Paceibacterota bacterium]
MDANNKKQIAAVVIPTYNEEGNIGALLDEIRRTVFSVTDGWVIKIVVVDGDSSDGTPDIVQQKMSADEQGKDIHLIREPKRSGIGAAYCSGFRYAIDELGSDAVIEFDGDFQHSPDHILPLLKGLDDGYDYVVASRSVMKGSEPPERSRFRKALTVVGGFAARVILFFPGKNFWLVTDPTTGLKATRVRGFADKLDLDPDRLYSRRFGYKVEWLYETIRFGAHYKEVPLVFENRRAGESKFSRSVIFDILRVCILVRMNAAPTRRFIKYAVVGLSGYIINAVFLSLLYKTTHIEYLSWILSAEAAIICNYFFNNVWTFVDRRMNGLGGWLFGLAKFNLSSVGAIAIEGIFGPLLTMIVGGGYRQAVLVFVVVFMVVPYNWFMYNRFIWKK